RHSIGFFAPIPLAQRCGALSHVVYLSRAEDAARREMRGNIRSDIADGLRRKASGGIQAVARRGAARTPSRRGRAIHRWRAASIAALLGLSSVGAAAQDATWLPAPPTNDWNTPANWSTGTVPSGTATFAQSNTTGIGFSAALTTIGTMQF